MRCSTVLHIEMYKSKYCEYRTDRCTGLKEDCNFAKSKWCQSRTMAQSTVEPVIDLHSKNAFWDSALQQSSLRIFGAAFMRASYNHFLTFSFLVL